MARIVGIDRALLQQLLAEGLTLAEIGRRVDRHEATVSYWLRKHGLRANNRDRHAARGALDRATVSQLVEQGLSIGQIARQVGRSKATVRHWLRREGLRTKGMAGAPRAQRSRDARNAGLDRVVLACARHGEATFVVDTRGYYRCARCRSEAVSRRRREIKRILVHEAGGACVICGYSRCIAALEFHHLRPDDKRCALSQHGNARSLASARAEAQKCVLLCANCHREVEARVTLVPCIQ